MKRGFFYICLILFLWYANDPYLMERKFFINEFLSLCGFFIFLLNPVIYKKNDYIYNNIMMILLIFTAYAAMSLILFDNFYGYLRNTVLVYSVFSFFLGIWFYDILSIIKKTDLLFLSVIFPFHRVSYYPLIPLYLSKYINTFGLLPMLLITAIMIVVMALIGGTTAAAIVLLIWFFYLLKPINRLIGITFLIICGISFSIYMYPYLDILIQNDVSAVMDQSLLLNIDGNATVRFLIWSYLIFKVFLNNIFGIGLGTPMIPAHLIRLLEMDRLLTIDPYLEYTLGAHNSFVTILVRFGILGIIPFSILYWKLIRDFVKDKVIFKRSRLLYFYYSFFIVTGCTLFNVVLESPIHASVFWAILGILYQAKRINTSNASTIQQCCKRS